MPKSKLTMKQKKFADKYLETGSKTEAYLATYKTKGNKATIQPEATKTTNKPQVKEYIEDKLSMAKTIIEDLANNAKNEQVRLQAARDIADRIEGKPVQRQINANTDTDKQYRWAE